MSDNLDDKTVLWSQIRAQEIERLEAELADTVDDYEAQVAELGAELAEWRRHGVRVTVDCDYCSSNSLKRSDDCPDCGGTGKKPRDGVRPFGEGRHWYVIPAEWLGAE